MAVGDPTGADLCVGTTSGDTLPASPSTEEREITFGSSVELTSGVKYAVVVRAVDAGGGADYVTWWRKTSDNYANGSGGYSADSGSSWTQESTDFWFATKASGVEKDAHKENDVSAPSIFGTTWRTQTFTASSTYTISSVVLKLSKGGSPGTVTVSIKATIPNVPSKPTTPVPADASTGITLDQATLAWTDGGGADTYNVYFGVSGGMTLQSSAQAAASWSITSLPLSYNTSYQWRIDATNVGGTTTGDTWLFTTLAFTPPVASGLNNMVTVRRLVAAANSKIWYEAI